MTIYYNKIDMIKLNIMYFSPTSTTKKVLEEIGKQLFEKSDIEIGEVIDFTLPKQRLNGQSFNSNDILLIGIPVYAGRVPNILLSYLNTIKGDKTL